MPTACATGRTVLRDRPARLPASSPTPAGSSGARDHLRRQLARTRDDETLNIPGTGADSLHAADFATTAGMQVFIWRPFFASSVASTRASTSATRSRPAASPRSWRCASIAATRRCSRARRRRARGSRRCCRRSSRRPGQDDRRQPVVAAARRHLRARRAGRTLLRASYGLFGSQLGSGTVQNFSAASQARPHLQRRPIATATTSPIPASSTRCSTWQGVDPAHRAPASTSTASIPT